MNRILNVYFIYPQLPAYAKATADRAPKTAWGACPELVEGGYPASPVSRVLNGKT